MSRAIVSLGDILGHWSTLRGRSAGGNPTVDDTYGFFQSFRPNGYGLEDALNPIPAGALVAARMRPLFSSTFNSEDWNFVVRRPRLKSQDSILELGRSHLHSLQQIAAAVGDIETQRLLAVDQVETSEEPPMLEDDAELAASDVVTDYVVPLESTPAFAADLREAFYSIACDYYLAYYFMWPWFPSQRTDLFSAYFELWLSGVRPVFFGRSLVLHRSALPSGSDA
jgi:hypothetical protein